MDPYNAEKTAEIWRRVLRAPEENSDAAERLAALCAEERRLCAALLRFLRCRSVGASARLRRLAEASRGRAARTAALLYLETGQRPEPPEEGNAEPPGTLPALLRAQLLSLRGVPERYAALAESLPAYRAPLRALGESAERSRAALLRLLEETMM